MMTHAEMVAMLKLADLPCIHQELPGCEATDAAGAALVLGMSTRQLRKKRQDSSGPPCTFRGRWWYRIDALVVFFEVGTKKAKQRISDGDDDET